MGLASTIKRLYNACVFSYRVIAERLLRKVKCNICQWEGRHFWTDEWHEYKICPKCKTAFRHRLLIASLSSIESLSFERLFGGKRILHFAPESRFVQSAIRKHAKEYVTADLLPGRSEMTLDMTRMPEIENEYFDAVIACDVLEHIPDDHKALCEIHRILKKGGVAILAVPQKDYLKTTIEFSGKLPPKEKEQLSMVPDHVRMYGDDFPSKLEQAGFTVRVVDENCFSVKTVRKNVLAPPVRSADLWQPISGKYSLRTNSNKDKSAFGDISWKSPDLFQTSR